MVTKIFCAEKKLCDENVMEEITFALFDITQTLSYLSVKSYLLPFRSTSFANDSAEQHILKRIYFKKPFKGRGKNAAKIIGRNYVANSCELNCLILYSVCSGNRVIFMQ